VSPTFFGQPRGLATLFFTEMWERFTYYGMRALLILFLVGAVTGGGFGLDDKTATSIYGLYTASVYLAGLPGGQFAAFEGIDRDFVPPQFGGSVRGPTGEVDRVRPARARPQVRGEARVQ